MQTSFNWSIAEITLLPAFLEVGTRGKEEMHLSAFSGLVCDSNHERVGITISVFSTIFIFLLIKNVFSAVCDI